MTEALRSYFLSITGAALICAVLQALVPSGTVKKVAGLIAGMIMIVTVLTPLTKLDAATIAQSISMSISPESKCRIRRSSPES